MIESRLSFEEFISIVKSFHFQEIVNSRGSRRRQRIFAMVFGGMEGFDEANDMYDRLQNLRAANGIKVLGSGVIKVVNRVEDARENSSLDLSNCQLIQVPVAVYFMMKQTTLTSVNLSFNVIKKISPKFPIQFNNLTELNLSNNQISNLPDEFEECKDLETVDISHNSFISLPFCFYSMPKLKEIKASKNFISGFISILQTSMWRLHRLQKPLNSLM
ncbi:leucine-rich repeat-containing protein 40 isoform X2 [Lepeophtheirus salmonis]|uniref:leucine-rich repeat-containing protein 40 isoform X2 n=1 Tax=Lepeophtheirus salmonis TaxID=72036 RepID=UPI001AEA3B52|nr:leucine-rich repeat-containing protein 20-like isoform X2 [Lepeophtheirus salmonis]